jgi:hypothetical protein
MKCVCGHWDTEHAAFTRNVKPGVTRTLCDHCPCRHWMTREDAAAASHPPTARCAGHHSRDWHGCAERAYHPASCSPRHTGGCVQPCESCHLTPEQDEAAAWIAAEAAARADRDARRTGAISSGRERARRNDRDGAKR